MAENYRGWEPAASDPAVLHQVLVQPGITWPADGRIDLGIGGQGPVRARWRFLSFETAGTVLIEDEAGVVLPYTRAAGAILPLCGVAIRQTIPVAVGGISATSAGLLLIGLR